MNTKKTNLSATRLRAIALVLAGGALLSLLAQGFLSFAGLTNAKTIPAQTAEVLRAMPTPEMPDPFASLVIEARAAIVVDLTNDHIVFAKNADEKLPLASLTKLMTALVVRKYSKENSIVTLTPYDLETDGDSGLRIGQQFRVGDLLDMMLIMSSNDAAHALASFVGSNVPSANAESSEGGDMRFVRLMNEESRTLGFTQTEFFNETGLDVNPAQNGGYGSAREVAALFTKLHKGFPSTLEVTTRKHTRIVSQGGTVHAFPNTNEAISYLPGLIASKTGYTTIAGGNLAIMFDGGLGHFFVAVVLGSTYKGRFEDMRALMDAVRGTL
ncbi:MAG: serine hydrolase [Patescibacteria group bacterium]